MIPQLIDFIRSEFKTDGKIPLHAPFIQESQFSVIERELNSGLFSTSSPTVKEFEEQLANYLSAPFVVATNSGTSALHASLTALGIQQGDIVITQALSFVATANTITYCGATPIFLDVNPETLSLSIEALETFLTEECNIEKEKCIHAKTGKTVKACTVVHSYGHPAELKKISSLLKEANIHLIEDAAQAFGSQYNEKFCGTFGRFGCFSFNGNKILTTASGGAIVCQSEEDYKRVKLLVTQGKELKGNHYYHSVVGYNYAMNGVSAAVGCEQLKQFDVTLKRKRKLADNYAHFFQEYSLKTLKEPQGCLSNFWLSCVFVEDEITRDHLIAALQEELIEARPLWWPLHDLPMYNSFDTGECINAMKILKTLVSLPSGSLFR